MDPSMPVCTGGASAIQLDSSRDRVSADMLEMPEEYEGEHCIKGGKTLL